MTKERTDERFVLTFASVPGQMPQAIDSVEGEGSGKDEFSSVLDGFGEITDKVNDMCAVKGSGGDEVGDGEPVEHYRVIIHIEIRKQA